ncbi:MAG: SGNH/GDSL hydrolase family protein [Rhodococcus sp. (in: high G+C Gram-positive bacteria)]
MGLLDIPGLNLGDLLTSARRTPPPSLADRIQQEGYPWYGYVPMTNVTLTTDLVGGSFVLPGLSRAVWVENLMISSNRQIDVQFKLGGGVSGSVQAVHRCVVGPSNPVNIPIRQKVSPSIAASGNTIGNLQIRNVLDSTATGAYVIGNLSGTSVYDDFDYAADKVMLIAGDSILNGTSGITDKTKSMEWMTRNYFRANGKRVRVINKSISGTTSAVHERMRAHGGYDFPQVDYLHYQLGVNDAGQALTTESFTANVAAMIDHKKRLYPKAQMVVWGPTPLQNNTKEAALVAMRSAAQDAVTEASDTRVRYASLATAFDRTNEANYAAEDTSGDKTHPVDSGHAAAFGLIETALNGWNLASLI